MANKSKILFFLYGEDTENLQLKIGFFVHKKIVSVIMVIRSTEEGLGCHTQCFIVADVLFRMHMRQLRVQNHDSQADYTQRMPATLRSRILRVPIYCFRVESLKYMETILLVLHECGT